MSEEGIRYADRENFVRKIARQIYPSPPDLPIAADSMAGSDHRSDGLPDPVMGANQRAVMGANQRAVMGANQKASSQRMF